MRNFDLVEGGVYRMRNGKMEMLATDPMGWPGCFVGMGHGLVYDSNDPEYGHWIWPASKVEDPRDLMERVA